VYEFSSLPVKAVLLKKYKLPDFQADRLQENRKHTDRWTALFVAPTALTKLFSPVVQRRSQWPCGLKHELSSPAPTLNSWVRIPLEAWMFMCVYSLTRYGIKFYSLCVVMCVGSGLAKG
jgi:hypothetical protein